MFRLATEFDGRPDQKDGILMPKTASSTCRLATGRSLLFHLIRRLPSDYAKNVLLPSYVAEGVVKPFRDAGFDLSFYRLRADLQPDEAHVEELLQHVPVSVFMLIHYFGYPSASPKLLALLRQARTLVVSDCAHAPLTRTETGIPLGEIGDIALFSLNKIVPVSDGAILSSLVDWLDVSINESILSELPMAALEAYAQHLNACRRLYDAPNISNALEQLGMIEDKYETYYSFINKNFFPYRQSQESRRIEALFPFANAARQRQRHAVRLHEALIGHSFIRPLWSVMPTEVVPFGFPVRVADGRREEVRLRLIDDGVLASTLIEKWDFVPRDHRTRFLIERDFLLDHLLLPVSEFMSDDDTTRLIGALKSIH